LDLWTKELQKGDQVIASDYFGFGIIASCVSLFFGFSLKHFIHRIRNGSLKFGRSREVAPLIYDEGGSLIVACSSPVLHKIKNGWCVWCGKSVVELSKIIDDQVGDLSLNSLNLKSIPQPDFNSPTTATVKPLDLDLGVQESDLVPDLKPFDSTFDASVTSAYCLRCKTKVTVLDPIFYDQESRRGVRRYLKGSCSVCKSKINAIVKRGD
jgi:hypothetical protein